MITIQLEKFGDCIEDIASKFVAQWEETEMYKDSMPLDPDWEQYAHLAHLGMLQMFVARDDEEAVGYALFMVTNHLHHKDVKVASSDIIYLDPEYRHSSVAFDLLEYSKNSLQEDGVSVLLLNMKSKVPFDSLASKLGYHLEEHMYAQWIGQ